MSVCVSVGLYVSFSSVKSKTLRDTELYMMKCGTCVTYCQQRALKTTR